MLLDMNKPSNNILMIVVGLMGVVATILVIAIAIGKQPRSVSSKIQIVASTNVWGDIAGQVGGDHVAVTSILNDPEADPHLFESDAKTASTLAEAQLVIVNGLGYDDFMNKLLDVAPDSRRTVLTVSQIMAAKSDANPHLWYDLLHVQLVAVAIQDKLIELDPIHTADYQRNTQTFVLSLDPALRIYHQYHTGGVAYTERVPEYMIRDLNLLNLTPSGFAQAVENGIEPSPQQVTEFEDLLKSGQVKVLLYNNQTTNDVTEQIKKTAEQAGVKVVGVSETLPKGKNFQTWQLDQLNAILGAL